jgi:DNA-binding protein Alba
VSRPPNIIFIGKKPIMTYVNATLTLLSNEPVVTIKARGKSITTAVDVSQMIVKRLNAVGYKVSGVRTFSERLTSQDGKERNVSTIEVDVSRP